MKKFSLLEQEIKPKYELKDSLRNEIFSLIENSLTIKMSNQNLLNKDIDIMGKDELVEKIKNLIDDVRIKERTLTLETVKANVHRNFDMKWLNEQITNLKKTKVGNNIVLNENIKDVNADDQYKAELLNYFVKRLNEIKTIGDFEFDYDPSDGIFKFYNEDDGIVVRATPFYNDSTGLPIEVFDEEQTDTHIFIEQRNFDPKEILFKEYFNIIEKFLVQDQEDWLNKKVSKYDKEELPDYESGLHPEMPI